MQTAKASSKYKQQKQATKASSNLLKRKIGSILPNRTQHLNRKTILLIRN
ncbi:MAG: hypothetical protein FWE54_01865 [Methanimicrococcus sp.]|nr:hypothetical protein [Methanimicrococcus sp.]